MGARAAMVRLESRAMVVEVGFHALRWGGRDYPDSALFSLRSLGGRRFADARRVRIFHAFGDSTIAWRGETHDVQRETIIQATGGRSSR